MQTVPFSIVFIASDDFGREACLDPAEVRLCEAVAAPRVRRNNVQGRPPLLNDILWHPLVLIVYLLCLLADHLSSIYL